MEFEDIIRRRTAVRKYSSQKLDKEVLNKILEAGRLAPTAKNIQPIKIYVVESYEGLNKIDKGTRYRYGAPTVLIVCGNKEESFQKDDHSSYEIDATIVTTHMMLEATNLNVDSVWVGSFDINIIKEEFDIPNALTPICLLPLGYKSSDCPINPLHDVRKSLDDLVIYK